MKNYIYFVEVIIRKKGKTKFYDLINCYNNKANATATFYKQIKKYKEEKLKIKVNDSDTFIAYNASYRFNSLKIKLRKIEET